MHLPAPSPSAQDIFNPPREFIGEARKAPPLLGTRLVRYDSPPSVRPVGILGPLQLHLQSLHANLEAVHGLYGSLRTGGVVKTHKTCSESAGRWEGLSDGGNAEGWKMGLAQFR